MIRGLLLLALATASMFATSASAAGFNLAWSNCGSAGLSTRSFACNVNTGTNVLVASFVLPPDSRPFRAVEVKILVSAIDHSIPSWWDLRTGVTGACRATSISQPFQTVGLGCANAAPPEAIGGYEWAQSPGDPSAMLLHSVWAVADADAKVLSPGIEYQAQMFVINNARTIGVNSCAGCQEQMRFELYEIQVYPQSFDPLPQVFITEPLSPNSNRVVWQGEAPVLVRNRTWGAIKATYR